MYLLIKKVWVKYIFTLTKYNFPNIGKIIIFVFNKRKK